MAELVSQRIGVFVDVQNLYYSAKHLYNAKVDFGNVLKRAVGSRELVRAIAYVIKADVRDDSNFFEALEKRGYEIKAKDLQIFYGGAKKGDWDVGISMDIMKLAHKLDVIVLISGDGDFAELIEHSKALGCRTEVVTFQESSSARLREVCDRFDDLSKVKDEILISQKKPQKKIRRRVKK